MKFKVTMKDPDGVYESREEAIKQDVAEIPGLSDEEREAVIEKRRETLRDLIGKWFEYDEYLTVEVDTEAGTCVVVPIAA